MQPVLPSCVHRCLSAHHSDGCVRVEVADFADLSGALRRRRRRPVFLLDLRLSVCAANGLFVFGGGYRHVYVSVWVFVISLYLRYPG